MKVWIVARYLTDDEANTLNIDDLTQERQSSIFETLKVKAGFIKNGIDVKIVNMKELGNPTYVSGISRDKLPDIIVIRCMLYKNRELMILNMLQERGVMIVNNPKAISFCVFKSSQYEKLLREKIPTPMTTSVLLYSTPDEILSTIKKSGLKFPLVVKSNCGSRADTVFKCFNVDDILESFEKINTAYPYSTIALLQEWISHKSKGVISVLTLGDTIIGAQQRTPNKEIDFFISNYRKDSNRQVYKVDSELHDITMAAVKCIGNIEMSRLDIFHDGDRYLVGEVNSPGSFISYDLFMGMDCGLMTAEYILKKYRENNS